MYIYYAYVDKDCIRVYPIHLQSIDVEWFKKYKEVEERREEIAVFKFQIKDIEEYVDPLIKYEPFARIGFTGCTAVIEWSEDKIGNFYSAGRGSTEWERVDPNTEIELHMVRKRNGKYIIV